MKFIFKTLLVILFSFSFLFSQTKPPTKEVRAVWVATVFNLDWPNSATSGETVQKAEIISILNDLKANNFNTIVVQVRARGDLIYPSDIEPWATCLTGTLGRHPGWDPLQFWIDESHKRGIEFHAWWNFANTVGGNSAPTSAGLTHIAMAHPEWVKAVPSGDGMFMDPGYPEAREYLINTAMEMVNGYDIDAIHFDYIRYHESVTPSILWWDSTAYRLYGNGENISDWRRENINKFVREIHDNIKAVKPWVKVGSTPVGNYDPIPSVGAGLWGYSAVYCDSRRWLREEKHDYLAPQIYWPLTGGSPFANILTDWMNNNSGRHIIAGVGSYNSAVYPQTAQIITVSRALRSAGNIFYSLESAASNNYAATKSSYQYPANIPAMPWLNNIPPSTPENLAITKVDDKTWRLSWDKSNPGTNGDATYYYNIYRSPWTVTDYTDATNLYNITTNNDNSFTVTFTDPPTRNYYFSVTALNRGHVESAPSNIVSIIVTDVADLEKPIMFKLEQNYPNPFNPTTTIPYHVASRANIKIAVYNILGQEVKVLVDEIKNAGDYVVQFDATNLSTGVYLYRMEVSADNKVFIDNKKMLLTK